MSCCLQCRYEHERDRIGIEWICAKSATAPCCMRTCTHARQKRREREARARSEVACNYYALAIQPSKTMLNQSGTLRLRDFETNLHKSLSFAGTMYSVWREQCCVKLSSMPDFYGRRCLLNTCQDTLFDNIAIDDKCVYRTCARERST